ncbi:MAG: prepilin-type N-terminal cleavage/methylation domain-containing protein [bacterium]
MKKRPAFTLLEVLVAMVIILALAGTAYCLKSRPVASTPTPTPTTSPKAKASVTPTTTASPTPTPTLDPKQLISVTLKVKSFPTTSSNTGKDGLEPTEKPYPATVTVSLPRSLSTAVGAYEAGNFVFLAPAGWTGKGSIGTDGGTYVAAYPVGGTDTSGPHFAIYDEEGCMTCISDDAATYFPDGPKWRSDNWPPPYAASTVIFKSRTLLTPQIVSYSLPTTKDGLSQDGIAYVGMSGGKVAAPLYHTEITLPASQHDLASTLLNDFIDRQKLKSNPTH